MNDQQHQDMGAELKAKIDELNLALMDDLTFQARRKDIAAGLGVELNWLKKIYREARAKRLAGLNGKVAKPAQDPWADAPFALLGVRGTDAVLFCKKTKQIVIGSTRHILLFAGGADFFFRIAPTEKGRINWDVAESEVMERAKVGGVFDPSRIRPRGAWLDEAGGLVINLGDRLLVDGETQALGVRGRHIYTSGASLGIPSPLPPALTVEGATPIFELLKLLRWRNPSIDPLLAAGFIVIAQVGGALSWRPNVWLVGSSQNGKTTLRQRLIRPLMRLCGPSFGAGSSEAGIRQTIGGDSLPWFFDESESETGLSSVRKVLALLRGNTSASEEEHSAKGTTLGRALGFALRSSALLCSITSSADRAADISRLTTLELIKSPADEYTSKVAPQWNQFTAALGLRLLSRIVSRWRELERAIALFKPEVARRAGSLRAGDQIGTLLAGAFFLQHDGIATVEEAGAWLDEISDWGDHCHGDRAADGDEADETRCLASILGAHLDTVVDGETLPAYAGEPVKVRTTRDRRTIGELIGIVAAAQTIDGVEPLYAAALLARFGIRIEAQRIWIANRNAALQKALGERWAAGNWRPLLRRLPGASTPETVGKFAGVVSRYTDLPLALVCSPDGENA